MANRPLGFATLAVLHAIARGVQVPRLRPLRRHRAASGTVYPALSRLEELGVRQFLTWEEAADAHREKRPAAAPTTPSRPQARARCRLRWPTTAGSARSGPRRRQGTHAHLTRTWPAISSPRHHTCAEALVGAASRLVPREPTRRLAPRMAGGAPPPRPPSRSKTSRPPPRRGRSRLARGRQCRARVVAARQ